MGFWSRSNSTVEVFSVHIPKTAGTSFRNILKSVYGSSEVVRFDIRKIDNVLLNERPYTGDKLPNAKVIHGHYNFQRLKAIYELPTDYKVVTWVRDPVERVLSNYYYLDSILRESLGDERNKLNILPKMERTLIEYARAPMNRNRQAKFFRGLELEEIDFIGIQEHYGEEVAEVARILNWSRVPKVVHTNPTKTKRPEISQDWIDEIREMNSVDIAIYERCLELRNQRIAQKETSP